MISYRFQIHCISVCHPNNTPRRAFPAGQIDRHMAWDGPPKKNPENRIVSGALPANQALTGLVVPFFYPDCDGRPWNSPVFNPGVTRSCTCVLVGCTTGRELHPAPKDEYSTV